MPLKKKVRLQDIASELNLTIHTVSKSLRGLPGMSEETRRAVLETARRFGYRTKEQERGFAVEHIPIFSASPRNFKFIITGNIMQSELHQLILQGLQEKMQEFGHTVQTLIAPVSDDTYVIEEWLEQQNVAYWEGVFIPPAIKPGLERLLLSQKVPRIMINFPLPVEEVDSVIWDVGTAIWQSVRYLASMNHTRILYIGDTVRFRGFSIRWRAFGEAMGEAGQIVNPMDHVIGAINDKDQWIAEVVDKLERTKPTAILSAVQYDLAWIYYACSLAGRSIPGDCSLISLENDRNDLLPGLTRPFLVVREAGARAAERMLWRLANPTKPYEHTLIQGAFNAGNTVLPLKSISGQG
jgi:LacI family transcriptional regulator